ncbi:rhamnogalacturonate lyase [Striga asiatica]|uniref:Rhamnogalacturonate lyase n=1 Tax=Striga asiatica TaxID=4170 RepID=A0A5A7PPI4_STRAF|nr:rhamnogalacturonate lyase [Striga asiatica]
MRKAIRNSMLVGWLAIVLALSLIIGCVAHNANRSAAQSGKWSHSPLKLRILHHHVVMDNGIVNLKLTKPTGLISGIAYRGVKNVLEYKNKETKRGYWDIVWRRPEKNISNFDVLHSTSFRVISHTKEHIEVSFMTEWNEELAESGYPLNIDKRFIMISGASGFYTYAIFEHKKGWPDLNIDEARIAFKLNQIIHVHGWISVHPHIGFWVITPSDEFRAGGPVKPDLTSHAGPTSLAMSAETEKWPYDFPLSHDFPHSNQRGTLIGRLLVNDWYINKDPLPAKSAYVGLARPGDIGSWQDDAELVYHPPRNGPTLWEIGIPDRMASEFYIPDPNPDFTNKLYINHAEKFRQYGLWDRYTDLYPTDDLTYLVGVSDYKKDWFYAHVNRKTDKNEYTPTTWKIVFDLENVARKDSYTLRIALASATLAEIQMWINDPYKRQPHFTTGQIGKDNAIARHGNHGMYWLFSVDLSGLQLVNGKNIIYLKQSRGRNPFIGVMYDYIRLEGPYPNNEPSPEVLLYDS